jgi:ATP-dependent helicase HrpB
MKNLKIPLPIDPYLDEILLKAKQASMLLIQASPGSGKTTRLPWALAKNGEKKVVVLEPRRLAAKLAAERIALEENFTLGEEVGYHFRFGQKFNGNTKLLFYTEGTFLRRALRDKNFDDVGIFILDEFHERHLETDMALAYLLELKSRRPEIKIILMSATLDTALLETFPEAMIINIHAPRFPVTIHHLPNQPSILNQTPEQKIRWALEQIDGRGDVLIFLPGMREILRVKNYLGNHFGEVHILHSEVPKQEQQLALTQSDRRKIVLSTNIAESSVTIAGVVHVIDLGIQREAHYSPWNGLKLIVDRPTTKSSAIQRAHRAGRTSPGVCWRLYSQQDFESREEFRAPEIMRADLSDTYLLAAQLGKSLSWPTSPPEDRWNKARELCYLMGYIDEKNNITPLAKNLYPVGLRVSRILKAGENLNRENKKRLLEFVCSDLENDPTRQLMGRLESFLNHPGDEDQWEKALVAGLIDQVAKFRSKQNDFIHYSGKILKVHPSLAPLSDGYYLVLDITQKLEAIKVIAIEEDWPLSHTPFPFKEEIQLQVLPKFTLKTLTKLGSIVFDEVTTALVWNQFSEDIKKQLVLEADKIFQKHLHQFQQSECYNRYFYWCKLTQSQHVEVSLLGYFEFCGELTWELLDEYFKHSFSDAKMEAELPRTIILNGRRELTVHYPFNQAPYIEAPIQEFYGTKSTPTLGLRALALTLKLLGPHKRPLQVTQDLAGFWERTYQEMKKELMREYPRHHWPDTPANAPAVLLKRHL